MACGNTLTPNDVEIVKEAVEPLGLTAIETVPEDLWDAYKELHSERRGHGNEVTIWASPAPDEPRENQGGAEPLPQTLTEHVSWVGDKPTTMDGAGHVKYIGNERVRRNMYGVATHIGNKRIFRRADGSEKYVENQKVHFDIYGNVTHLEREEVTPASWRR